MLRTCINPCFGFCVRIARLCRSRSSQAQEADLPSAAGASVKRWQLMSAVCLERLPQITAPMNNIETDVSEMFAQLELEHSLLSSHELRHLDDL